MSRNDSEIMEISQIFFESIRKKDEEEMLRPEQLKEFKQKHFKLLYPHKDDGEGVRKYFCCQAFCLSPGYFCCCRTTKPENEFVKFGLSICLYFKFLKHSICFYLFMSALAILSSVVCFKVASQNGIATNDNYSNFLFSTTYGSFSSEKNKCQYSLLSNSLGIYSASFDLTCPAGEVSLIGPTLSTQSLNSIYNCRNEHKKQQTSDSSANFQYHTTSSSWKTDKSVYSLSITFTLPANTTYTTAAYTYNCVNNHYTIGSKDIQSRFYFYFVVGIDIFICLWFMIFLGCEIGSEKVETEYFKKNQVSLDDYSIKIKGFRTNTAEREFQALLNQTKKKFSEDITNSIVSYTFPDNEDMFDHYKQKFIVFQKIQNLIKKYYISDKQNEQLTFKECHDKVFQKESASNLYKQYRLQLAQLINKVIELEKKRIELETQSNDKVSLLLVFDSINQRKKIKKMLVERCCSGKSIQIGKKFYEIQSAPLPDMIIWENKYTWTKLRVFFSWIMTLLISIGSYLLFGYIQYEQSQLLTKYNYDIDCNVLYTSAQLSTVNQLLSSQANYVTCICKDQGLLNSSSQNSDYCSTWKKQYVLYLAVPLLISLGLVVYNIVVSYLFKLMSRFQKHKLIIDEELSFTFKRAFLLIMNMGLIMILLNINYRNSIDLNQVSFIFLGKYDDFTSDWYENIGAIIILTMIFNIATPIAEFLLAMIGKCLKKCWDSRCGRVPTSRQTKSDYLQYFSDDIFPVGERYAYLIATFFITFSFSGVIPLLIPIVMISLLLLYLSDKILMFKFYQTPINYTQTLHKILINVLIISIVSHYSLTAYFLSQSTLIANNSSLNTSQTIVSNARINNMLTTVYIYPYLGLLALILIYFLLKNVLKPLKTVLSCCMKKGKDGEFTSTSALKESTELWGILSKLQLDGLLKVSQFSLDRYKRKMTGVKILASLLSRKIDRVEETNKPLSLAEGILRTTVDKLQKEEKRIDQTKNLFEENSTVLIGLPSYQYMINSEKLSKNAHMMKLEVNLTDFYMKRQYNDPQAVFHNNQSESATNLHADL